MQVQVHPDNHVNGSAGLTAHVESVVTDAMQRFGNRVTRVEVHLGDENSHKKSDNDKRSSMEARPAGLAPIAVTSMASTINEAIDAAADKLVKTLQKTFDKKFDAKGRPSAAEFAAAPEEAEEEIPALEE